MWPFAAFAGTVAIAACWVGIGGLLEVLMAAIGAYLGGLTGLSLGWTMAVGVEAIFMLRPVYQVATLQRAERATK